MPTSPAFPASGPKVKPVLARLIGGETLLDLRLPPAHQLDRPSQPRRHRRASRSAKSRPSPASSTRSTPARGKWPTRVRLRDDTGFLTLIYFHANQQWLERTFKIGEASWSPARSTTTRAAARSRTRTMSCRPTRTTDLPEVEPVYPMTANLTAKALRKFMAAALEKIPELDEWIDPHLACTAIIGPAFNAGPAAPAPAQGLRPRRLPCRPRCGSPMTRPSPARWRWARHALRASAAHAPAIPRAVGAERTIVEALPFKPTRAQMDAYSDVAIDMGRAVPMRRMIQGDVGSGKTLVAALAAAQVAADWRRHRADVAHRSPRPPAGRSDRPLPQARRHPRRRAHRPRQGRGARSRSSTMSAPARSRSSPARRRSTSPTSTCPTSPSSSSTSSTASASPTA